jgi:hypothetical protein
MVNWANFLSFLIVLAGAIGGFAGANAGKAGTGATAALTVGGLVVGLALAKVCDLIESWALRTKRLTPGEAMGIYATTPVISILLTLIGTARLATWLARHIL